LKITKREAALRELCKLVGVHEDGSNNRGRMVDIIEAADSLPGNGYSWCQSTQNYAWLKANGEKLAGGTASVFFFVRWAADPTHHAIVNPSDGPKRGDHVTFAFHGGGPFDHVAQIERVLKVGPVMYLQTIEGNTGASGAVSDPGTGRDGVYRKRRVVARTSIDIVRVLGDSPHEVSTPYELWRDWYRAGRKGTRPNVPLRISAAWWARFRADLKKRRG
jgi:hypothetical protein